MTEIFLLSSGVNGFRTARLASASWRPLASDFGAAAGDDSAATSLALRSLIRWRASTAWSLRGYLARNSSKRAATVDVRTACQNFSSSAGAAGAGVDAAGA